MGCGSWSSASYNTYTTSSRGMDSKTYSNATLNVQQVYKSYGLSPILNPKNVTRLCHDSDDHPNSMPIILALDVTGSMGDASMKVSQKLDEIMTALYDDNNIKDPEFCIMGIGDLECDDAPVQISQFESDIRIAEQLDKIYFEAGGGGNRYESYTVAWYMGIRHCELDCWKHNRKGLIITMGDEGPNPYLPASAIKTHIGDNLQGNVETKDLYTEAIEKFDIYHISVDDKESSYQYHKTYSNIDIKWKHLLGEDHYKVATLETLASTITDIVKSHYQNCNSFVETSVVTNYNTNIQTDDTGEVYW